MQYKYNCFKRVLNRSYLTHSVGGYVLIMTSGIMFFIIAAVTILHLMSAKSLKQQYRLVTYINEV